MKRVIYTALGVLSTVWALVALVVIVLAIWHGWSIAIGQPGGFYMELHQLPMKRFF